MQVVVYVRCGHWTTVRGTVEVARSIRADSWDSGFIDKKEAMFVAKIFFSMRSDRGCGRVVTGILAWCSTDGGVGVVCLHGAWKK